MKPTVLAVLALMLAAPAAGALDLGRTTTVDRLPGALPFDGVDASIATGRSVSDDGRYVAFESDSDALWGPNPGYADGIFRADLQTGEIVLASVRSDESPIEGDVGNPTISGDGRFIAFDTEVPVLAADTNDLSDIYVRDLQTGLTALVSCVDNQVPCEVDAGSSSHDPVISGDGSTVAFLTEADLTDATIEDSDGRVDAYARRAGRTHLVSVHDNDTPDNTDREVGRIDVNGDGTSVAFTSETDLSTAPAVEDTGTIDRDVFVRSGIGSADPGTACVSHGGTVNRVAIGGDEPSISDAADRVAFTTNGDVGTDSDGDQDAYTQRGGATAVPILMSATNGTADGDHNTIVRRPIISADGTELIFEAGDTGFLAGDHVYLRDGTSTTAVDRADGAAGALTTTGGFVSGFARDGSAVAFGTDDALDAADGPGTYDVYIRDANSTKWAAKPPSGPTRLGAGHAGIAQEQVITPDGRYVVFSSAAAAFGSGTGVYRRDLVTGELLRVDVALGGGAPDAGSNSARISADGTRVSFHSPATNLVAGDDNDNQDVFVRDLVSGVTRIAVDAPAAVGGGEMSADGKRVLVSTAAALDPADDNTGFDAYVVDVDSGAITLASRNGSGQVQSDNAYGSSLSGDGNRVAFATPATNMPDGDAQPDVYVRDIAAQTTTVVSRTASGGTPDAPAQEFDVAISEDGNRVAFQTRATNLGDGDTDTQADLHVRDLTTGALIWATRLSAGALNGPSFGGRLSTDGHKLFFSSLATNADPADSSPMTSAFVKDLDTGALTLAARTDTGDSPQDDVYASTSSDDAGCIVFATNAGGVDPFGYPSRDYSHVYVHALSRSCPATPAVQVPGPGGGGGDTTKPAITGLKVKSARKRRVTITFTLSEDATVRLRVLRQVRGTRRAGKCVKKRRTGKKCIRLVARGTVTRAAEQGDVKIVLKGKAGKKRLARGRHRIEVRATDAAGNVSARKRSKRFRVKR